jgi:hypothetical protein
MKGKKWKKPKKGNFRDEWDDDFLYKNYKDRIWISKRMVFNESNIRKEIFEFFISTLREFLKRTDLQVVSFFNSIQFNLIKSFKK